MSATAARPRFEGAIAVLFEPGDVVELRGLKDGSTASGYFEDRRALCEEAAKLEQRGFTVYATINPPDPTLLARAKNRMRHRPKETTADRDIRRRRWLPVDLDPVRPAGVSSTDAEKRAALARADEIRAYLGGQGWPDPVVGDSGNGAHLLYRVNLPNDEDALELVKNALVALSFKFSDAQVAVDTSTSNAARIWKLYGTTARKGDGTEDRPHRVSTLLRIPEDRKVVGREQLRDVADAMPQPPTKPERSGRPNKLGANFDLESWVLEHGVPVVREGPWQQGGYRWVLEECPWNGHTDKSAFIVRWPSGVIGAGCHHDSCQGYGWRDLRAHYEPDAYGFGRHERNGPGEHPEGVSAGPNGEYGILLSEVVPERVRWLWPGRIVRGKLNLVDGDPGTGKSAVTTDLAARVSTGKRWPDGSECEVGGVVILSAEDGLADTIRPRFDAAGGDPSKAVAVSTVPDAEGQERQLSIPNDISTMEAAIERVRAVLVVIDPLMAFLPGEVNSHRDQDVRRALAPLARLAERTGAAVVVVRHLNKANGGNPLYRGGGSIGIIGAARSGLLIAKHPEDDGRRVLASIKCNLAAPAPSLVFGLASTESGAVRVAWKGESNLDASALLSAPTDHEERSAAKAAQDFLRETLSDGPEAVTVLREHANAAGVSWRTVERAKADLGIRAVREGEAGKRGGGGWVWTLPTIKAATSEGWRPKCHADRTDAKNTAYTSQDEDDVLRPPSTGPIATAEETGGLNRPLYTSPCLDTSATLEGPSVRGVGSLSSQYVRELFSRAPQWLRDQTEHCRRLGAPSPQVEALAAAVAAQLSGDPTRGGEVLAAVEAEFHTLGCGCEECL